MGACCQADQGKTAELDIPSGSRPGELRGVPQKSGGTKEQFENQRLEIFQPNHNNQLVLEVISQLEPFDWSQDET